MNELVSAVPWLGKRNPMAARWLIIILATAAPIIAMLFGRSWVRILDFALLYMMLALGLNLVVGFAGLLDLGYIAFYAVGAYSWAFLASPHFGVHLPFWMVLPLGVGYARGGNVRGHRKTMQGLYIGACIIAGLFTLLPGRFLGSVLFGTPATGIAG